MHLNIKLYYLNTQDLKDTVWFLIEEAFSQALSSEL